MAINNVEAQDILIKIDTAQQALKQHHRKDMTIAQEMKADATVIEQLLNKYYHIGYHSGYLRGLEEILQENYYDS